MNELFIDKMGMAPEFVNGGLPVLLFTLSAFCLLGFTAMMMRTRASGVPSRPLTSTAAIFMLLLGLAAFMVAVTLKIA